METQFQVRVYVGQKSNHKSGAVLQYSDIVIREAGLLSMAALGIPGASMFHATGVWEGNVEPATVFEFVVSENNLELTAAFASDMRREFEQDAVLRTVQRVQADLHERKD